MTTLHSTTDSALTHVTVGDVMRPGVISCPREATLSSMAATLVTHGIHAVVVSPLSPATPLIVTDMDLVRAAVEQPGTPTAADVAREPIVTVSADATLDVAVEMMAARYVTHLLATDPASGAPAGILSSLDVAAVAGGRPAGLPRSGRIAPARPSPSARTLSKAIVSDVMHPGVVTVAPETSLSVVARTMADHRVHCIAVAGIDDTGARGQHITWGLLADIDLITALRRAAMGSRAAPVAATEPLAVEPGDSLQRAAALMVEHGTAHLVVVGATGLPSGIISTLDVALILAAGE